MRQNAQLLKYSYIIAMAPIEVSRELQHGDILSLILGIF